MLFESGFSQFVFATFELDRLKGKARKIKHFVRKNVYRLFFHSETVCNAEDLKLFFHRRAEIDFKARGGKAHKADL